MSEQSKPFSFEHLPRVSREQFQNTLGAHIYKGLDQSDSMGKYKAACNWYARNFGKPATIDWKPMPAHELNQEPSDWRLEELEAYIVLLRAANVYLGSRIIYGGLSHALEEGGIGSIEDQTDEVVSIAALRAPDDITGESEVSLEGVISRLKVRG